MCPSASLACAREGSLVNQVFLSYSLPDEREAAEIREELRRLGLNVWWDSELSSKSWAAELCKALEQSDSMIMLVSPAAVASDLVRRELRYALSDERLQNRLFPVLIKPT